MIYFQQQQNITDDTITVFVQNFRSLSKHIDDVVSDNRIISNIVRFIETQINISDFTWKIMLTLNIVNINLNNDKNKSLNLAYRCRYYVTIFGKFDAKKVSIFSFEKHAFAD